MRRGSLDEVPSQAVPGRADAVALQQAVVAGRELVVAGGVDEIQSPAVGSRWVEHSKPPMMKLRKIDVSIVEAPPIMTRPSATASRRGQHG